MKTKFIVLLVLFVGFAACKNEPNSKKTNTTESNEVSTNSSLHLNNGEKWQANAETQEGLRNIRGILDNFNSETIEEYQVLGNNLSEQTNSVIKNCTMQGEAHDQLHVVLIPILEQITILKESKDLEKSQDAKKELDVLTDQYFKFFKI